MGQLFIHSGKNHILGLFAGELGDFFQLFLLLFIETVQLFFLRFYLVFLFVQLGFPLFQVAASPVQIIFLLDQSLFVLLQLITALFVLLLHVFTKLMDFLTGLYKGFLLQRFRFPGRIVQHFLGLFADLAGLLFCRADAGFRNALAEHVTDAGAYSCRHDAAHNDVK